MAINISTGNNLLGNLPTSQLSGGQLLKIPRDGLAPKGMALNTFNPSIGLGNLGASNKYPMDLSPEKSISIHVYDTSKYEKVYSGLIDTTQNVASGIIGMFSSAGSSAISAFGGQAESMVSTIGQATGGLWGSVSGGLTGVFKNFVNSIPNVQLSPGNMKLAKTYHETFHLPIPNNLQESLSNGYEEKPGWINDMPGMNALKGLVESQTTADGSMTTATWSKLTGARSIQYYENQLQMYTNTEFREITLQWDLVPNNEQESRQIHEIVRKIKMYGSPETAAGKLILKSPCFFGIEFNNKVLEQALQFTEVVLISAEIEYVPGGNMEMYDDQMPKHLSLSLTFKDREPKLREDWANPLEGNNSQGSNNQNCPT